MRAVSTLKLMYNCKEIKDINENKYYQVEQKDIQ